MKPSAKFDNSQAGDHDHEYLLLHLAFFADLLLNSPKCSPRISLGYEDMEKMFYFLNRYEVTFLLALSGQYRTTYWLSSSAEKRGQRLVIIWYDVMNDLFNF